MINKNGIYNYQLSKWQFDFNNQISFIHLINFMLESAGKHAHERSFGIADLMQKGKTWVLSQILFEFITEPSEEDEIFVETWVEDIKEFYTYRRLNFMDKNKKIFAEAVTRWSMIDFSSRKIIPLIDLLGREYILEGRTSNIGLPGKIPLLSEPKILIGTAEPKYSDIDINKHVTTTSYIKWVLDSFPIEFYQNFKIMSFEINFNNEVFFGESIAMFREELTNNKYLIELINNNTNKIASKIKIEFSAK